MPNILNILSEYGKASRRDYPQGDNVEDAMDTIIEFCHKYGYEFSDDEARELRSKLYLCPLNKGIFRGVYACTGCPHLIKRSIYSYSSVCNLEDEKEKINEYSL